jgi:hypothetical protein
MCASGYITYSLFGYNFVNLEVRSDCLAFNCAGSLKAKALTRCLRRLCYQRSSAEGQDEYYLFSEQTSEIHATGQVVAL